MVIFIVVHAQTLVTGVDIGTLLSVLIEGACLISFWLGFLTTAAYAMPNLPLAAVLVGTDFFFFIVVACSCKRKLAGFISQGQGVLNPPASHPP